MKYADLSGNRRIDEIRRERFRERQEGRREEDAKDAAIAAELAAARANGVAVMTASLLNAEAIFAPLDPVNWMCQALDMAPGAPSLIAGYGYTGKTVATQDFALAVASGTPAWGRFPVRRGRVLHLDYEQGSRLTRSRYQRLARARGIDPRDLQGRLTVVPFPKLYLDDDNAEEILSRLGGEIEFLIVDSFRAACPRTDENSSESRVPLDRLARVSEKTGMTCKVIHHARKPSAVANGGPRMTIRGSGALFDACSSVFIFSGEKGKPVKVVHEKARISGRTIDDFRLAIEDVESDGDPIAGLRVSAITGSATEDRPAQSSSYEALKTRILELIRVEGGSVAFGANVISARLCARKNKVSAALTDLVASNALQGSGSRQEPVYSLPEAAR
ncbi:AAA family ATPase [Anaeromyxobacter oryzisoli]|uniref:AAA family ATPase n=1 Tax=Anaeromyxobacter oryzisoli TaxID=2925408 RepID=UPI001F569A35|nr:AAA family ATPase [Anaeromyxobacter sp. SG63]